MIAFRREPMRNSFSGTANVLTFLLCSGIAHAGEKRVQFSDLPPAVQKTAQAESQGATIKGYSKEVEHGKLTYEVEMVVNGKSRDVSIDPSGKVVEVEQEVSLEAVPPAALTAIQAGAKGGAIPKVEEVKSDSETVYEAQVRTSGKHQEIRVHADGSPAPEQD
jgi:uncharacterized membrane protein YkoI